jgi:hypothetical protein
MEDEGLANHKVTLQQMHYVLRLISLFIISCVTRLFGKKLSWSASIWILASGRGSLTHESPDPAS